MLNWLRNRKLAKLKQRLEVTQAEWDHEMWFTQYTGTAHPVALAIIAKTRADLTVKIRALEAKLK